MNRVDLIGRLTKDPELKFLPGGGTAVTKFTIAVDDYDYKNKQKTAQFIPVTVWGKTAERLVQFTTKGSLISVCGKIRNFSYDAKDGTKRYGFEIVADYNNGIRFLSSKPNGGNTANYNNQNQGYNEYNNSQNQGYNQNTTYTNQNANQNNTAYNNQPSQTPVGGHNFQEDHFANAFGGFGDDMIPVDDTDMPF